MVKPKTRTLHIFMAIAGRHIGLFLPGLSLLTFIFSLAGLYPSAPVERWYSRGAFPQISRVAGWFADSVSLSWLDLIVPIGVLLLGVFVWKRRWRWLLNVVAALYLIFFWTWGLNYHRQPLHLKLQSDSAKTQPQGMKEFSRHVAAELNRLYSEKPNPIPDAARIRAEAVQRVRRVVAVIDGSDWESAHEIKVSRVMNPWFRAAGIDGLFNPLGHEPIVSSSLLDVERPFVLAHELAHVRGYPDEGDANLIAILATVMSDDPFFQYSGWLNLWLYVRNRELDKLLDPGPRSDIQRIFERAHKEQIGWINNFQGVLLDWFLKANSVNEGVRSYSRVVLLAAGTEPYWDQFR